MSARRDELLALETAITEVGRDRVFAMARANGWTGGDLVPVWVWHGIVAELRARPAPPVARGDEVTGEMG